MHASILMKPCDLDDARGQSAALVRRLFEVLRGLADPKGIGKFRGRYLGNLRGKLREP